MTKITKRSFKQEKRNKRSFEKKMRYEIKHFANCMKENYNKYYEQKVRD